MARIIVKNDKGELLGDCRFEGSESLLSLLRKAGISIETPCSGRGICGGCAVDIRGDDLPDMTPSEMRFGTRLACQTVLRNDAEVWLQYCPQTMQIETGGDRVAQGKETLPGAYGAACDVGTTTVVLRLYAMDSGEVLAQAACRNPQAETAADVIGRIDASMHGQRDHLQHQILTTIDRLLSDCAIKAGIEKQSIESMVITGNTAMLYLLTGKDPSALSHAPFAADCLFGEYETILGRRVFLPACSHAFTGADLTCAILASDMCEPGRINLLCDIGTNGEIALWKDGRLYMTSTAAGPAFEGSGISCGLLSVPGSIDAVVTDGESIQVHVIGEEEAAGVCGSGLIDAVAAFLDLGWIDETGAAEEKLTLTDQVEIQPVDIRKVQLAKAAIAAGIEVLLKTTQTSPAQIDRFYIAGGFGNHLNMDSAVRIGLIPKALRDRVCTIGNAALTGASMILLDQEKVRQSQKYGVDAIHVDLGGNPAFNEAYIDQMLF